jgi:hypothetical protein
VKNRSDPRGRPAAATGLFYPHQVTGRAFDSCI